MLKKLSGFDWTFATPDWENRIRAGKVPADLSKVKKHLNKARADKALKLFNRMQLADVIDQPFMEDACGPWFKEIVQLVAGGIDATGVQRINDLMLVVPKKNSKTSYGGLLLLTLMLMSPRPRGQYILVAPSLEIANLAFSQIAGAVYVSEALTQRLDVKEYAKLIIDRKNGCRLWIKTFNMNVATGSRPSAVLLDEAWLLTHPDAHRVIGQLRGGMASVPEGTLLQISTVSDQPAEGYWRTEITKARGVRDGKLILPGYLPVIYEPPADIAEDMTKLADPKTWGMVNPNLDLSVTEKFLRRSFNEALNTSEVETIRWLSQHVNAEPERYIAAHDDAWTGADVWADAGDATLTLDQILETSARISVGIDGGGAIDMLSLTVIGEQKSGAWHLWNHSWLWPVALKKLQQISGTLQNFIQDGDLTLAQAGDDLDELVAVVQRVIETGKLATIGLDPANVASEIANRLTANDPGLKSQIVAVNQGFKLRPGFTALERRVRSGELKHADQPLLNWAVTCAKMDLKNGLVTKKVSSGKIDALVASATAAMCILEAPQKLPDDIGWMIA